MIKIPDSDIERFEKKYKIIPENCWLWLAGKDSSGYSAFRFQNKIWISSRFMWLISYGEPLPECVCHSCDNPSCVNPDHLFAGSSIDNIQDRINKNRTAKGSKSGKSKLTEKDIKEIRKEWKYGTLTQKEIAKKFNISQGNVVFILSEKTWKHIL